MNDSNQQKFRQLGLFTTIVAEVVVTPLLLGGLIYWLTRGNENQTIYTGIAAMIGLTAAFYRIFLLAKSGSKTNDE